MSREKKYEDFDIEDLETLEVENPRLSEVLDFYDAYDVLPLIHRVMYIDSIKEAVGHIPGWFNISRDELHALLWFRAEIGLKMQYDNYKMREESHRTRMQTQTSGRKY